MRNYVEDHNSLDRDFHHCQKCHRDLLEIKTAHNFLYVRINKHEIAIRNKLAANLQLISFDDDRTFQVRHVPM